MKYMAPIFSKMESTFAYHTYLSAIKNFLLYHLDHSNQISDVPEIDPISQLQFQKSFWLNFYQSGVYMHWQKKLDTFFFTISKHRIKVKTKKGKTTARNFKTRQKSILFVNFNFLKHFVPIFTRVESTCNGWMAFAFYTFYRRARRLHYEHTKSGQRCDLILTFFYVPSTVRDKEINQDIID